MHLFGSRGIPGSIRRVTGFGVHTFKMVAGDGSFRYCKFHFRPVQSVTHFSGPEATCIAGVNPDFHNQDLADAISRGQFPVWRLFVQVMEPEQAETYGRALFDITKVWPHKEFPLIEIGKMTLNQNVSLIYADNGKNPGLRRLPA
jgi:catalase